MRRAAHIMELRIPHGSACSPYHIIDESIESAVVAMNKHADLFRMIIIIYYLLIGSVLFSACSPLPIVTTPEPQTAEPTAAATEQPA